VRDDVTLRTASSFPDRAGHRDSFTAIFQAYQARIYGYLRSLVSDPDVAADLAQDTFVKAYRAMVGGQTPENPSAWLYAIATNTALSALRRRRLIAWLPLRDDVDSLQMAADDDQEARMGEREMISQALRKIPRDDAACLLLRFQQELSYPEIAAVLGTTVPAAKMRLSRARSAFREAYMRLDQQTDRQSDTQEVTP
jgi:RNA polymerase sigma-70 factor, ECF subfamily